MTRRERLERRAERRREWAAGRSAKAAQSFDRARTATEHIPFGQPILVGHHSERGHRRDLAKGDSAMRAGCESAAMAETHEAKADGIEAQLSRTIFSDDPDAVERLQEKIDGLEKQRETMKAVNKCFRKGGRDALAEQFPQFVGAWDRLKAMCPYEKVPFPSYALTNSGAEVRRAKKRIEAISAAKSGDRSAFRGIAARFDSDGSCGHPIAQGDAIGYDRTTRRTQCAACWLNGGAV